METSPTMNNDICPKDEESLQEIPENCHFDLRADVVSPGKLYLASGIQKDGSVFSSFVHVIEKHVDYNHPLLKDKVDLTNPEGYRELCRRNIFWLVSGELQFDEESYVDASWAPESIDVCKEFRLLSKVLKANTKEFDNGVLEANDRGVPAAPFRVLDLACGIGGNLVYIGLESDLAVGVEYNPRRVEICRNNVKAYGLSNTFVVQQDLFEFVDAFALDPKAKAEELGFGQFFTDSLEFDCVHISPPWGGKLYAGASDERIYELQSSFDIERAMVSITQIAAMVSIYLPRSQSIAEIVRLASNFGYPLVIISAYYVNKKVRCIHAQLLKRIECFKRIKMAKLDKVPLNFQPVAYGLTLFINSQPYQPRRLEFRSSMNMDHVLHCLMVLLGEKSYNVAFKIRNLMRLYPLVDVLGIASKALEIQNAGGMTKVESQEKRTTGGIFFYLLKMQQKELYKKVEKLSQPS